MLRGSKVLAAVSYGSFGMTVANWVGLHVFPNRTMVHRPFEGKPKDSRLGGGEEFMDKDYTEYTEQAGKGSQGLKISIWISFRGPTQKVDPDSGVSVRRPTDLVCVLIFLVYIIGMLLFLAIVKNTSIA